MLNRVILVGNLGADPEIKYSGNGTCIANMRVAVNDHRKDGNGNTQQQTYWFTAVAFGKTAEVVGNYCSKGSKIGIDGKLIQREWEDNSGQKRNSVEIRVDNVELLGTNGQSQSQGQSNNQGQGNRQGQGNYQGQKNPPPPPPQQGRQQGQQGNWHPPPPQGYQPPPDDIPF